MPSREIFLSYKGYSPPKCTCNGTTHIQVKTCTFLLKCLHVMDENVCDAPNPGGPLTTRQPAEIYESHVMRPIHVQKWPLGPTHHAHKMYILYKNDLFTIVFNYNLYKNGSLAQNFTKTKYKIRPSWPFLRL